MKKDRREVIIKSMKLAAASYVAPATMNLLTAQRATAQSCATCNIRFAHDAEPNSSQMEISWTSDTCGAGGIIFVDPGSTSGWIAIPIDATVTVTYIGSITVTVGGGLTCGQTFSLT